MKLPWNQQDKIQELEGRIETLQEEKAQLEQKLEKWKSKFEAEEERRSELSRKKQEAEEELKRLRTKLEQLEQKEGEEQEETEEKLEFRSLNMKEVKKTLEKIGTIQSGEKELVTVYSPGSVEDLSELTLLKNSVSKEKFSRIKQLDSFAAFIDPELGTFILKATPFFSEKVSVGKSFDTEELTAFIEKEKNWCLVSAGETLLYREENGSYEEVERVKTRVEKEHSKGGFSQGRFERKRNDQIDKHLKKTEKLLKDREAFILGNKQLCQDLEGKYVGGFDPNMKKPEQFYQFRLRTVF